MDPTVGAEEVATVNLSLMGRLHCVWVAFEWVGAWNVGTGRRQGGDWGTGRRQGGDRAATGREPGGDGRTVAWTWQKRWGHETERQRHINAVAVASWGPNGVKHSLYDLV